MYNRILFATALFIASVCSGSFAQAQMVDCDIFLKGSHLEIGINSNGAFGTSVEAPAGYHANITDTLFNDCTFMSPQVFQDLGFVADPNLTNWSNYYGDFILPGNPREGWAIEDGSGTATAYSYNYYTGTSGFSGSLTGANVAYITSGTKLKGSWSGAFHSTLNVNQVTTIDTVNLYLMVHVGFYNTGTTPDSFYYLRTINPHNDEVLSSNPNTKAKIEHQLPNPDGLVVVSATGIADTMAYIALGTRDPRAKCFIIKDSTLPGPGTLASIWAGDVAHYNYTDTLSGNHGIGLVYKIGLGPGDSSFLDYGYSFKGGVIDTVLDSSLIDTTTGGGGTLKSPGFIVANGPAIFPNPSHGLIYLTGLNSSDQIEVFDMVGREINPAIIQYGKGSFKVSLATYASGTYYVFVRDENGKIVSRQKVLKD